MVGEGEGSICYFICEGGVECFIRGRGGGRGGGGEFSALVRKEVRIGRAGGACSVGLSPCSQCPV